MAANSLIVPLFTYIFRHSAWYTLSEAWSGVNWADLRAAQGAFGADFYDRSILRPKHRAYYRYGRTVINIGPKGALGSHEIRPIHSAPSLGQSIEIMTCKRRSTAASAITLKSEMGENISVGTGPSNGK